MTVVIERNTTGYVAYPKNPNVSITGLGATPEKAVADLCNSPKIQRILDSLRGGSKENHN